MPRLEQGAGMKRRDFIAGLGGATAWPLAVNAQQGVTPIVGFLSGGSPGTFNHYVVALRRGLAENGFADGHVAVEYRWAEGQLDRLPALANDLVRARVSAICAGGPPAALAVKATTSTIPIVFTSGEDPVKIGLVASYNQPGGNVTGIAILLNVLNAKRLGLLRELVPAATLIAVMLNPTESAFNTELEDVREAALATRQKIHVLSASTEGEIDAAFAIAKEIGAGAMLVGSSFFFSIRREQVTRLAARAGLPAIYGQRDYITIGGLISYGTNVADAYYQAGGYMSRILKGARPADLPVVQTTKFELVINLKTAKDLGLDLPLSMQQLADEVSE